MTQYAQSSTPFKNEQDKEREFEKELDIYLEAQWNDRRRLFNEDEEKSAQSLDPAMRMGNSADFQYHQQSAADAMTRSTSSDERPASSSKKSKKRKRKYPVDPSWYPPPAGFLPSGDERYYHHPRADTWFDRKTAEWSVYDGRWYRVIEPSTVYSKLGAVLRLVVTASNVLTPGGVVLVDAEGITIGRDRAYARRLRLPEMMTSKFHCQIYFDPCAAPVISEGTSVGENDIITAEMHDCFFIVDVGSSHGTYKNGMRLSIAKKSSEPFRLQHLDEISIGSTRFQCHLHPLDEDCHVCQIRDGNQINIGDGEKSSTTSNISEDTSSLATTALTGSQIVMEKPPVLNTTALCQKESLEAKRREEIQRLKRKFQIEPNDKPKIEPKVKKKYIDRAALRRERVGIDPYVQSRELPDSSEDSVNQAETPGPINTGNIGHRMLQRMGWVQGQSLGTGGGILDPIGVARRTDRAGLGAANQTESHKQESFQEITMRKARERFMSMK
ncbi:uncharacterized protein VTP21DRAFT_1776 [Calcarisporiella thermophila]|uniref:uncharacterized protein n=1 Tax=Calcarisporiella thermophila TaxID=911321 RepID=UPI0037435D3F